jgi:porin
VSLDQDPANLARSFLTAKFPRLEDPGPLLQRMVARFFRGLLVPTQTLNRVHDSWDVEQYTSEYSVAISQAANVGISTSKATCDEPILD